MPPMLFHFWVVGVVLISPVVFLADRFFVNEYGPLAGYVIGLMGWVFAASVTYIALRLVAAFLQDGEDRC